LRDFQPVIGILEPRTAVAPLLDTVPNRPLDQRHFSSFPLTSHLHNPIFRLVSLHPLLSITCSFLRVPEIHDGYEKRFFISATTTVGDVISLITRELGLTKTLPIPGGGTLEYAVEEVWLDGSALSV
jgi:diaphanous 1